MSGGKQASGADANVKAGSAGAVRSRRSRRQTRRTTPGRDLFFATLLLAVALVPSWPLYANTFLAVCAGGAWLLGLASSWVSGRWRWPWYLQMVVTIIIALLGAVPLAVPHEAAARVFPTLSGLGSFVTGLVGSWVEVLSVDPPLGMYDALLTPVYVLAFVGGFLAWRGAFSGRRALVVLGPAAVLAYGLIFGARVGFAPIPVGAALLVVALLWVISLRPRVSGVDEQHTRRLRAGAARRSVAAVVFVGACAVGGSFLAQAVVPEHRASLRTAFEPEYEVQRQTSPLQEYRRWVTGSEADAEVASVRGLPSGSMLRVAVMDQYNGVAMETGNAGSSGTFTRLPAGVARPEAPTWHVQVTLRQPLGEWLPLAGSLSDVSLSGDLRDGLYYNKVMDTAVVKGGVPPETSYELDAVAAPAPLRSGLNALTPGDAYQADLVQVPEQLVAAGRAAWAKQAQPGAQLQLALAYLQAGGVSHGQDNEVFSRSGHSAERLNLLAQEKPMVGDAEQYAAAFAVLAREVGFPSRVVLGYVDTNGDGVLTGSELTAWVEVEDARRGWVSVDPNPEPREIHQQKKSTEDAIARPRTVLPPDTPRQEDTITPRMDESPQTPQPEPDPWVVLLKAVWWWTWRVGLALAVLLSPFWLVVLLESLRRGARRRRDRRDRTVTGAWNEVRDEALDRGIPIAWAQTRREIAEASGMAGVAVLARRADELSFAPEPPQPAAVDEVWKSVGPVRKELKSNQGRWRRLRQRYSWRSLVRWVRWASKS